MNATTALLTGLLLAMGTDACKAPDPSPPGAALLHARTVIEEGEIQVSPDTVAASFEGSLEEAAAKAGFSFGHDHEAVTCRGFLGCEGIGSFRGLVHVVDYARPDPDSAVVTLRMLLFTSPLGPLYEQVDEVHVTRSARSPAGSRCGSAWRKAGRRSSTPRRTSSASRSAGEWSRNSTFLPREAPREASPSPDWSSCASRKDDRRIRMALDKHLAGRRY